MGTIYYYYYNSGAFVEGYTGLVTALHICQSVSIFGLTPVDYCQKNRGSKVPYHYYVLNKDHDNPEWAKNECDYQNFLKKNNVKTKKYHNFKIEHQIYSLWRRNYNLTMKYPSWS